jgi:Na+/phosphate symporter
MLDTLYYVGRVVLGWCGISLIVGGLWIWVATSRRRVDRTSVLIGLALIFVGAQLVRGALTIA